MVKVELDYCSCRNLPLFVVFCIFYNTLNYLVSCISLFFLCSPINGLDSGTNAKHLPPRKGSDLQRLVEETEDVGDDEKKQVTSISSEDHSKLQESIISGEASDKIVSLRSEEVDASENLPNALQLA